MHPSYLYNHTPPTYIYPLSLHDALPISMAKELIAANPDRIVWGTNWPHPNSAGGSKDRVSPLFQVDNGLVLNQLSLWAPDAATRKKILVDNPARLYKFT